jgi:hypothetical protein
MVLGHVPKAERCHCREKAAQEAGAAGPTGGHASSGAGVRSGRG